MVQSEPTCSSHRANQKTAKKGLFARHTTMCNANATNLKFNCNISAKKTVNSYSPRLSHPETVFRSFSRQAGILNHPTWCLVRLFYYAFKHMRLNFSPELLLNSHVGKLWLTTHFWPDPCNRNASGCTEDFCVRRGTRRVVCPSCIWPRLTTTSLLKKTRQKLRFYFMVLV